MKFLISSFIAGLVFAVGLGVSGMTQADKVIGFLNVAGDWDPSLALVMGGAIVVHWTMFRFIARRESPILGGAFGIPTRTDVDARLVGGSALFGIGWALGGYCPGPGLVSLGSGSANAFTFVASMTAGMLLFQLVDVAMTQPASAPDGLRPQ